MDDATKYQYVLLGILIGVPLWGFIRAYAKTWRDPFLQFKEHLTKLQKRNHVDMQVFADAVQTRSVPNYPPNGTLIPPKHPNYREQSREELQAQISELRIRLDRMEQASLPRMPSEKQIQQIARSLREDLIEESNPSRD